jgi:hypothetical protein
MKVLVFFFLIGCGVRWYSNGMDTLGNGATTEVGLEWIRNHPVFAGIAEVFFVVTWPVWVALGLLAGAMKDVETLSRWIRGQGRHDA